MSPKFRQEDGFTFKIYSNEEERMHIVLKAECEAKFWLEPRIELANNYGFNVKELRKISQMVEKYGNDFKQQFTAHIGKRVND